MNYDAEWNICSWTMTANDLFFLKLRGVISWNSEHLWGGGILLFLHDIKAVYINGKMLISPWWLISLGKQTPFCCDLTMEEENTALILIHYKLITQCTSYRNTCDQGSDVNYVNEAIIETRSNVICQKQSRIEQVLTQISGISHKPRKYLLLLFRLQRTY